MNSPTGMKLYYAIAMYNIRSRSVHRVYQYEENVIGAVCRIYEYRYRPGLINSKYCHVSNVSENVRCGSMDALADWLFPYQLWRNPRKSSKWPICWFAADWLDKIYIPQSKMYHRAYGNRDKNYYKCVTIKKKKNVWRVQSRTLEFWV